MNRKNRRHRDSNPMFPFGDIMLPVIGLVALGLLIVGVKMFFLPEETRKAYEPVPEPTPAIEKKVEPVKPQTGKTAPVADNVKNTKTTTEKTSTGTEQALTKATIVSPGGTESTIEEGRKPSDISVTGKELEKQNMIAKPVKEDKPIPAQISQDNKASVQQPVTKAGEASWGVQIGSFTNRGSADSLATKVSSAGYTVRITEAVVSGKRYHRVTAIAGDTRNSALVLEEKLKKEGYPTFVTSLQ
ncbi:MAG: SPOR domain-containing protein [Synergistales bacterium]|nr:SPOR domain-containing protein [Synergistales bacterium]